MKFNTNSKLNNFSFKNTNENFNLNPVYMLKEKYLKELDEQYNNLNFNKKTEKFRLLKMIKKI